MSLTVINSNHPKACVPYEAFVEICFEPGHARAALDALCKAVMDVLVEARNAEDTHTPPAA